MLIQDLAVILLISGLVALLFQRLNQPKVIGYVLAGLIVGPYTPPFSLIQDQEVIRTLGDIGLIFLMFSLGLNFNLRRMRRVGPTALITAVLDVGVMVWLGYLLGRRLGWAPVPSLFLGGIVCDSSSSILAKILQDLGRDRERFAGITIGITILEDLLAVVLIAVLTGVAQTGHVQAGEVAGQIWYLILALPLLTIAGLLILPRLIDYINRFRSDELLIVALAGLCFGAALLAIRLRFSLALGAVLIGAIVSESRATPRIAPLVDPLRHVFSAVFFVTIGLRLNPAAIAANLPVLLLATALVIVGKFVNNVVGTLLSGQEPDTAIRVGGGMAQVGEFAFIIAALALSLGVGGDTIYEIGVGTAVLSTLLSPYLIRLSIRAADSFQASALGKRWSARVRFYGRWIGEIGLRRQEDAVRRAVRRSLMMIAVNLILIVAIFAAGSYAEEAAFPYLRDLIGRRGLFSALVWMACMAVALPLYLATIRKINAVALILAEAALPLSLAGAWARPVRMFISSAVTLAGIVGLILLSFMLGSTMLPSREVLLFLTAGALAFTLYARNRLVRVYSRAQGSLAAMLSEPEPAEGAAVPLPPPFPELSGGVAVETVELESLRTGAAIGQTLRDLNLRGRTGATLIAIERQGKRLTNPDPNQPFAGGDRLFLLGSPEQILAAVRLLTHPPLSPAREG